MYSDAQKQAIAFPVKGFKCFTWFVVAHNILVLEWKTKRCQIDTDYGILSFTGKGL